MQTNLININSDLTMSSLDIVNVINSIRKEEGNNSKLSHSDFLKKVPEVIGEKNAGNFSSIYKDAMNRDKPCYRFPKRESMLMAMSYSYSVQAAVYDAYDALENKNKYQLPDFTNPAEAAIAWAQQYKEKQQALALIEQQKPLVEFANVVQTSYALIDLKDMAKLISDNVITIGRNNLMKLLRDRGFLNLDNTPSQKSVNAGLMKAVEKTWVNSKTGNVELSVVANITTKGQVYFLNNVRKFLTKEDN